MSEVGRNGRRGDHELLGRAAVARRVAQRDFCAVIFAQRFAHLPRLFAPRFGRHARTQNRTH
jgi:hypothetical protein